MTETTSTSRRSIGAARNPESHEAILNAAQAVLEEMGVAGFSIEAVARRAKAGKPTIYRWWPSRAHLLLDVYHRQKSDSIHPDTGSLNADLEGFLVNLTQFWSAGPAGEVFRCIVAEAQSDPKAAEALKNYSDERIAYSAKLVERARARGEVADWVNGEAVSNLLSAYCWKLLLTGRLEGGLGEIRQVARMITEGISAR